MSKERIMTALKYSLRFLPDEVYIKLYYRLRVGRTLNLKNPQTLNEKIQWLKFNYRHPLMSVVSDKYLVRDYVAEKIGEEYLIPLYGVWDRFDEIDFSKLPNQFVLKCNHDSGGLTICWDKSTLDISKAKNKIEKSLKRKFFLIGREYQYRLIRPRIIAEAFISDDGECPADYKIYCYNGKPDIVMLCKNRFSRGSHRADYTFYDRNWNRLNYMKGECEHVQKAADPRPQNLDKMFTIAEKLSREFLFARIDLYEVQGKVYFGEITLTPNSGFDPDITYETDLYFGKKLEIPYFNDLCWQ